jgi:hypothetical protein
MYNGVGIVTPRGSGTSGHVQKNAATVRTKTDYNEARRKEEARKDVVIPKDAAIMDHEAKRKVEVKVQLWIRENDIRGKYDKETAARMIKEKRAELTPKKDDEGDDLDDSRGGKRRKEYK